MLVGAGVFRWVRRGFTDPLADAPPRPNQLRLESLLAAALIYVLVSYAALEAVRGVLPNAAPCAATDTTPLAVPANGADEDTASGRDDPAVADPTEHTLADSATKIVVSALCLVFVGRRFEGGVRGFLLGRGANGRTVLGVVGLTLAALVVCDAVWTATVLVLHRVAPGVELEPHATIQALHEAGQPVWVIGLLRASALIVAPIAEEVFFRGMLQSALHHYVASRWSVVLLTSFAFTILHSPYQALPTLFVLSVVLGVAYERSGALVVPVGVHLLFNGNTLLWDALG